MSILPSELEGEWRDYQRKAALAQALTQMAMSSNRPPQQLGRMASPMSPFAGLGAIAGVLAQSQFDRRFGRGERRILNRAEELRQKAIEDFIRSRSQEVQTVSPPVSTPQLAVPAPPPLPPAAVVTPMGIPDEPRPTMVNGEEMKSLGPTPQTPEEAAALYRPNERWEAGRQIAQAPKQSFQTPREQLAAPSTSLAPMGQNERLAADIRAATSIYPELRQLGLEGFKESIKAGEAGGASGKTPGFMEMRGASLPSRVAAELIFRQTGDRAAALAALEPDPKFMNIAGTALEVSGRDPRAAGYFGPSMQGALPEGSVVNPGDPPGVIRIQDRQTGQWEPHALTFGPNGGIVGIKKLDNSMKTTVQNTTINQGKMLEKSLELSAAKIDKIGEAAAAATSIQTAVNRMRELDKAGVFSNTPSGAVSFIVNTAQAAGVPISQEKLDKLGRTETFRSMSTQLWVDIIGGMERGQAGVTKTEADEIRRITPILQQSPQARQRIYEILDTAAERKRAWFKAAVQGQRQMIESGDIGGLESIYLPPSEAPVAPVPAPVPAPIPSPDNPGARRGRIVR